VDEFWVCQHCRSLNRAGSGKCYHCRNKFGSKPKADAPANKDAAAGAAPASPPSLVAPPAGVPSQPAPYFTRPVALPAPDAQPRPLGAPPTRRHFPNPVAAIERRISGALALRPSVNVTLLGYLSTGLLGLTFILAGLLTLAALPAGTYALQHADLPGGWGQLSAGQQAMVRNVAIVEVVVSLFALLSFSLFIGLSTHNTTGLGAEVTLLMPRSGGTVWPGLVWVHIRIAVGLLLPTLLIWYGYELPGLIAAVLVVEVAQRHLDNMLDWLGRPARHLPDLHRKFGRDASKGAPLATAWSILFWVANVAAIAVYMLPALGLTISSALKASGHDLKLWQAAGFGPAQLAIVALFVVLAVSAAGTLIATIGLVLGLVTRQRTRRTLVRVGRSRSWTARPGEGSYGSLASVPGGQSAGASATASEELDGYGDEDRLVERYPQGTFPPGFVPDDESEFGGEVTPLRGGQGLGAAPERQTYANRLDGGTLPQAASAVDPRLAALGSAPADPRASMPPFAAPTPPFAVPTPPSAAPPPLPGPGYQPAGPAGPPLSGPISRPQTMPPSETLRPSESTGYPNPQVASPWAPGPATGPATPAVPAPQQPPRPFIPPLPAPQGPVPEAPGPDVQDGPRTILPTGFLSARLGSVDRTPTSGLTGRRVGAVPPGPGFTGTDDADRGPGIAQDNGPVRDPRFGPGFRAPAMGVPSTDPGMDGDQASLNSPSTTSSPPWSPDSPPSEPPSD
jgi:hypothetical protein